MSLTSLQFSCLSCFAKAVSSWKNVQDMLDFFQVINRTSHSSAMHSCNLVVHYLFVIVVMQTIVSQYCTSALLLCHRHHPNNCTQYCTSALLLFTFKMNELGTMRVNAVKGSDAWGWWPGQDLVVEQLCTSYTMKLCINFWPQMQISLQTSGQNGACWTGYETWMCKLAAWWWRELLCERTSLHWLRKQEEDVVPIVHRFEESQQRTTSNFVREWDLVSPSEDFFPAPKNFEYVNEIILRARLFNTATSAK